MSEPEKERERGSLYGAECFALTWLLGLTLSALGHGPGFLALTLAALLFLTLWRRSRGYYRSFVFAAAGALLGTLLWGVYDYGVRRPLLALDGTQTVLTARVREAEMYAGDRARYTIKTELQSRGALAVWYAGSEIPALRPGDTVTLDAELEVFPSDYRFDTAAYRAGKGEYLRITDAKLLGSAKGGFSVRKLLLLWRERIVKAIRRAMPPEEAGLLTGMLFGDRSGMSDEAADLLYDTGIGHITAVSGLHLVFFTALLAGILRLLGCPARLAYFLEAGGIALFALLVDASFSVARAAVMLLITNAAALFGRRGDTLRSLCLAAVLCTVFTPYAVTSASFWLSVSGVFGVGVAAPLLTRGLKSRLLKEILSLVCVSVSVFPASVMFFGESSLIAPLGNLILLPVCTAALYLGLIFVFTGGFLTPLLTAARGACSLALLGARLLGQNPLSKLAFTSWGSKITLLLCCAALFTLLVTRCKPRYIGVFFLAAALVTGLRLGVEKAVSERTLRVALLGRPEEAAAVISYGGQTALVDFTGDIQSPAYAAKYLQSAGISELSALVLLEGRNAAAYQKELSEMKVERVLLTEQTPWREGARLCGVRAEPFENAEITLKDVKFTVSGGTLRLLFHGYKLSLAPPGTADSGADIEARYGVPEGGFWCAVSSGGGLSRRAGENLLLRLSDKGDLSIGPLEKRGGIAGNGKQIFTFN